MQEVEGLGDAVFVISSPKLLDHAFRTIDQLFDTARDDINVGDIYEMLLSEITEAGKNGQFLTPRHLVRAMCDIVDPQIGETVCDPACGTAGFLVGTLQHIRKTQSEKIAFQFRADGSVANAPVDDSETPEGERLNHSQLRGYDFDRTMIRLGWMNLNVHGVTTPHIRYADTLGYQFYDMIQAGQVGEFDVVLSNPPFLGNIDTNEISRGLSTLGTNRTELLFIELILRLLQADGRAAVIVPEGLLSGSSNAHIRLRQKLVMENQLMAVISLPREVFQPYTSGKASILVFKRGGRTEEVWFYDISADGYTLNARRDPAPQQNDLWDVVLKYRLRHNSSQPRFADDKTWGQWKTLPTDKRSWHYARPRFTSRVASTQPKSLQGMQQPISDETKSIKEETFAGLVMEELSTPKDWVIPLEAIARNDYRLNADFYKSQVLNVTQYEEPQVIIGEILELEAEMREGLKRLLKMVEGEE